MGGKTVFPGRETLESVAIQGEEPRSLTAGQICPAGVPAEALIQGLGLVVP